ncbi:hypothetical protein ZIOFF_008899 [Zingiber officinale]|uniref:Uncharacterized protein n=1 Tax=Zingiber officinale TaxID=94328 RepID=A0A8J5LR39_ZINOF|nr:hypothetical protein ZIOFF_008899 [Zingiber officinale]
MARSGRHLRFGGDKAVDWIRRCGEGGITYAYILLYIALSSGQIFFNKVRFRIPASLLDNFEIEVWFPGWKAVSLIFGVGILELRYYTGFSNTLIILIESENEIFHIVEANMFDAHNATWPSAVTDGAIY